MAKNNNPFDDIYDPNGEIEEGPIDLEITGPKYQNPIYRNHKDSLIRLQNQNILNEVKPPQIENKEEMLALREKYKNDFVAMHQEVFKTSSGLKPLGPVQIDSTKHSQHIINHGGRVLKIEPRGLGKTTRSSNEALGAVLYGKRKYVLIIANSVPKAEDILESIRTELCENEMIEKMFPNTVACFRHVEERPGRARYQTFKGVETHISISKQGIQFPCIDGEDSFGSLIQVRPKDNLRGIIKVIKRGPLAGTRMRPDLIIMDDIQTDEEASSPTSVKKIINTIKKSALRTGTHAKRVAAIKCATPIAPGDTVDHFANNEPAWEVVRYQLLKKKPTNEDLWTVDYASILLDFDKTIPGDRTRAQLAALDFYKQNKEAMDEGAQVAWDWAYGWEEEPQTEISALQHAYNILIEEGMDVFNSECQCITDDLTSLEDVLAPHDIIMKSLSHLPKYHIPLNAFHIVTHIDVHKEIITYATAASPKVITPTYTDYGTWPEQPAIWDKANIIRPISQVYAHIPEPENRVYQAVKDLIIKLNDRTYFREDGLTLKHNLILVDSQYMQEHVFKACRESGVNCVRAYAGVGLGAKDKDITERSYSEGAQKHHRCVTAPSKDNTLFVLYVDVNYMKLELHKAFKARTLLPGSASLYHVDNPIRHKLFADHCVHEKATEDSDPKNPKKTKIVFHTPHKQPPNDFFDNATGCLAGLSSLGCTFHVQGKVEQQKANINDIVRRNKPKDNLPNWATEEY